MKSLKIVTIGGGSSYTPELIEGFIKNYPELPVSEICLVDIEEGKEKLEIIGNLARRMVAKADLPIKISTTLNRKEALVNADFVTTQFRVGMLEARSKDEKIPLKYETIGQETNGPGGLFKALRTILVILEICQEMMEICPKAWLINFTNPAGLITQAIHKYSPFKNVIGVCNGPIGMQKQIEQILESDASHVYVEFAGLNHMVFAKNIYLDDENVTTQVIEQFCQQIDQQGLKNIEAVDWNPRFIKALNMLPIDYVRYYWQSDLMLEAQLKEWNEKQQTRADVVKRVEQELFEIYQNERTDEKPKQLEERGGAYYSEVAVNLINSIYNDKRDIHTVNVLNQGAISDLNADEVVEVNSIITKHGPIPLATGSLPLPIRGIIQQIKAFELMVIEAAIEKDYDKVLLALVTNPLSRDDHRSEAIINELAEAHKKYLFN
ncbi:6-phospho-beta-glucosidase [Ignavigranum ruoffiae]|uniref:6-phospho-beta-glucosidase n=1 Tax=Ignavigranum ruoffiae TaxID=89093 RepID=UPI002070ACE6|nr:6-phospho-beta-glucosidase [Ignavigranum ruoffiae]UPQ86082.1 6-phospho-beta-glucosidase [Ignavigranum ruoffiae]